MRALSILCCFYLCGSLILLSGCEREKDTTPATITAPAMEVGSKKPEGNSTNVALNKTYAVKPEPNGYAQRYMTDATDSKKPMSDQSCFGYSRNNTSVDVTLDVDLGETETINGAALYTFFNRYDEQNNECNYGANYVEVYGSETGNFEGEEKLLGNAGEKNTRLGAPGSCVFEVKFKPYKCRHVRFVITKQFGDGTTGTDWLFIKEVEVWKAVD